MFKLLSKLLPWRGDQAVKAIRNAGMEAAEETAKFIVGRASALAPERTGDLKRSIRAVPSLGGRVWNVVVLVHYAFWVEYGSMHGNTWIPPNPFLRRAVAEARQIFPGILKESLVTNLKDMGSGKHLGMTIRV